MQRVQEIGLETTAQGPFLDRHKSDPGRIEFHSIDKWKQGIGVHLFL